MSGRAQAAQLCSEAQVRESELVKRPQLSCLHRHPLLHLVLPHEVRVQNAHAAREHHDLHEGRSAVRPSGRPMPPALLVPSVPTVASTARARDRRVHTPTGHRRELTALQRALTSRLYSLVKCAVNSLRVMSRTCAPFAPAVHAAVTVARARPCDSTRLFGGDATAQKRQNERAETSSAALRRLATSRKCRTCLAHGIVWKRYGMA